MKNVLKMSCSAFSSC